MQIPLGYCGKICSRSGLANKHAIVAFNGIIDPGFSGVVKVLLFNFSDEEYLIQKGTRIAQMIFVKTENVVFKFDILDLKSDRNNKGFGSSGDPLSYSKKFYQTIAMSDLKQIDFPNSYAFVAAAIRSQRDDVYFEKEVLKKHFKDDIELKLLRKSIFLSSMKKRAYLKKKR